MVRDLIILLKSTGRIDPIKILNAKPPTNKPKNRQVMHYFLVSILVFLPKNETFPRAKYKRR